MPDYNPKPSPVTDEDAATRPMSGADSGAPAGSSLSDGDISGGSNLGSTLAANADSGGSYEGSTVVQGDPGLAHKTLAGGKYKVDDELGRGGMSVVYAATDTNLGRKVAVKVLLADYAQAAGPDAARRFHQEARSVAKLSHPHIISIYEYDVLEDGAPYIVMDFVVGDSLSTVLENDGSMPPERVFEIIKQSAEALRHSHGQSVVHRDIKPSNLLLTRGDDGEDFIRVVDFGIAKRQDQDPTGKLTRTGQVFGSPLYMSPEQCEGLQADARSDIYSLGCVAYELITGRPPHVGKNAVETMHRKMTSAAAPFSQGEENRKEKKKSSNARVEQEKKFRLAFEKVILRMLANDPADRQQSADALLVELKQLRPLLPPKEEEEKAENKQEKKVEEKSDDGRNKKIVATQTEPTKNAGRRKALIISFAAIVSAGAAIVFLQSRQPPPLPSHQDERPQRQSTATTYAATTGGDSSTGAPGTDAGDGSTGPDGKPVAGGEDGVDPELLKKPLLTSDLVHWKNLASLGHQDMLEGKFPAASRFIKAAVEQVEKLSDPEKSQASRVSLSDGVDLALMRGDQPSRSPVFELYQNLIAGEKEKSRRVDEPIILALSMREMSLNAGEQPRPEEQESLLKRAMERATVDFDDERFGDSQKLLVEALPLLRKYHESDGRLAAACHRISTVMAVKKDWGEALKYAEMAVESSKTGSQMDLNQGQALYLKGWAQANSNANPVEAYTSALQSFSAAGSKGDMSRLSTMRKLTQYYQESGQNDQATRWASQGIRLAEGMSAKGTHEARRLEQLAYFYFASGRLDDAIKTALKGIQIEDRCLPRQNYRLQEELKALAKYYEAAGQTDAARFAQDRGQAIFRRLKEIEWAFN